MLNVNDLFQFATAPRTGSTWFLKACHAAGLGELSKSRVHIPPAANHKGFVVTLVRHPCDWLAAYYAAIFPGSVGVPQIDALRQLQTYEDRGFDHFIYTILDRHEPGVVGRVFDAYRANSCLRIEDTPWNVIELFDTLRVPRAMRSPIANIDKQNTTKVDRLPQWDTSLRRRVIEAEREFCDRFDY